MTNRDPVIRVAISPRSCQTIVACGLYNAYERKTREAFMGAVMIKCPDTGRNIRTGMVADRESFRATPVFFARVLCPLCGSTHEWFAQEAWVCDGEEQPQRYRPAYS